MLFPVPPEKLEAAVRGLSALGMRGCNVTTPHKQAVFPLLDRVDDLARLIGAVNTVVVEKDGTLTGFNNDGNGFIQSLRDASPSWRPDSGPILVLGAGGASRAVVASLAAQGAKEIRLVNRTRAKAEEIADAVGAVVKVLPWEQREDALDGVALLANATSGGAAGKPPLDIALDRLPRARAGGRPHLRPARDAAPGCRACARQRHGERPRAAAQSGASGVQRVVRRDAGDHARRCSRRSPRRFEFFVCNRGRDRLLRTSSARALKLSRMRSDVFAEPKIDCHVHVLDPARFPYGANTHYRPAGQETGTAEQLFAVMDAYGTRHALIVGPNSGYGLDNRCLLDALARSAGRCKGVAVVANDIGEASSRRSARRASSASRGTSRITASTTTPAPPRCSRARPRSTCSCRCRSSTRNCWRCCRCSSGRGYASSSITAGGRRRARASTSPASARCFASARPDRRSSSSRVWPSSRSEPFPHADAQPFVDALIDAFTLDRCLWASDWPYLRAPVRVDYGVLLALVMRWFPDDAQRRRVLWDTPAALLRFAA